MNPLNINIEEHPLEPFLPHNARLLMLGSFPPQRKRWCMEFYYPNFINDMWRIVGHVFFDDKHHFVDEKNKCFKKDCLIDFLNEKGIALFDTATAIRRLQDNASDKFLEVITPTDVPLLLKQIRGRKLQISFVKHSISINPLSDHIAHLWWMKRRSDYIACLPVLAPTL